MALQHLQTSGYSDGNRMQGLEIDALQSHWMILAILGLLSISPGLVTFLMLKTHALYTSLVAWQYGISFHAVSVLLLSGIERLA